MDPRSHGKPGNLQGKGFVPNRPSARFDAATMLHWPKRRSLWSAGTFFWFIKSLHTSAAQSTAKYELLGCTRKADRTV